MSKEGVPNFNGSKFGSPIDTYAPTQTLAIKKENDLNFIKNNLTQIRISIGKIKESDNLKINFAKLCNSISGIISKLKEKGFIRNYEKENREFFELKIEFLSQIVDFSISKIEQNKKITNVSKAFKTNFRAKTPNKITLLRKEILETQFEKFEQDEQDIKSQFIEKIDAIETKFREFFDLN